ncbi:Acg family FMN-binding oxidoreductase [Rhodovulum sp. YNF3179]|uniref:Acg family FMN-binding oxidoreductase n=1 Tax=Rhodovulum sp. YNF3179 TaxID=3425127 RepID=UPI003D33615E
MSDDTRPGAGFHDVARALIAEATKAPSSHNSQPWRFRIHDHHIDVLADWQRSLPVVDPEGRELIISCGAVTGALEVTARARGFTPETEVFPLPHDFDVLARVRLGTRGKAAPDDAACADALATRRTNRAAFAGDPPDDALWDDLAAAAAAHDVMLVAAREDTRETIADLVAEGDKEQLADAAFRAELACWVHSTTLGSHDGMSAAAFGMPDILAPAARLAIRTFDMGDGIAADDARKIMQGSPLLAALATQGDGKPAWLATGRALMDVLLRLERAGLAAAYLNQPIEVASLRPKLGAALGLSGSPQLLLRIGQPSLPAPASVRRPVEDVLA